MRCAIDFAVDLPVSALEALRIFFALGFAVAVYGCDWLSIAPNRLLPGTGVNAVAALGPAIHGLVALLFVVSVASRGLVRALSPELAFPVIAESLRIAAILAVATAAIGAIAGAATLGAPIIIGLQNQNETYLLQGAAATGALAFLIDAFFLVVIDHSACRR